MSDAEAGKGSMKALWFGPDERPLFGWLHLPAGAQARGAVVLCPTLGIEAVSARYAYRRLADRLAGVGLVTLRFDYDGTGDSGGGDDDPGRVDAWLQSIRHATDFVRRLGPERISVVGLRAGATLAAEIFGPGPARIDDLVLWDPCASGRAFIREQGALWSIVLGGRANPDGSVETPGLVYNKETVAEFSGVAIANTDGPLADRVLLLTRSNRKGDRRMRERLDLPHVERVAIEGQEGLVDVQPDAARTPEATLDLIVEWLDSGAAEASPTFVELELLGQGCAVVGVTVDGTAIVERTMSLGPVGLFGIMTAPQDASGELTSADTAEAEPAPTVFLLNAGALDHVGPARLWVQLSRRWAAAGVRVVRFDLTGIGDSPMRMSTPDPIVYAPDALDDVLDALRAVSPDDPSNAILVGLCSGGYHAVEAALVLKVRGLCAINPILTIRLPELNAESLLSFRPEAPETTRTALGARKGIARRALPAHEILSPLVQGLPDPIWWVINRIAVESPPARLLSRVVEAGVNLMVIAGEKEARFLSRGEGRTMRRLRKSDSFHMDVIPDLEHSLFERYGRERAAKLLTEHILGHSAVALAAD